MGSPELVYVSGRVRSPGEINGKSGNLNNALNLIYPPGQEIPLDEVICVFDADQARITSCSHGLPTHVSIFVSVLAATLSSDSRMTYRQISNELPCWRIARPSKSPCPRHPILTHSTSPRAEVKHWTPCAPTCTAPPCERC